MLRRMILLSLAAAMGCASSGRTAKWYTMGVRAQKDGEPDKARAAYERVLADAAAYPGVHTTLAILEMRSSDLAAAAGHLAKEIEHHPALPAPRLNDAMVRLARGDGGGAGLAARAALERSPASPLGHLILGLSLMKAGTDPAGALAALERAAAKDAPPAVRWPAHFARGVLRAQRGEHADAAADFMAAHAIKPNARALYNRAVSLIRAGESLPAALDAARSAAAIDPKAAILARLEARLLLRSDRPDDARKALERARALAPDHAEQSVLEGRLAMAQKDWAAAVKVLDAATRAGSAKNANVWVLLGIARIRNDQLAAAHAAFAKAALLDPKHPVAARNRDALATFVKRP